MCDTDLYWRLAFCPFHLTQWTSTGFQDIIQWSVGLDSSVSCHQMPFYLTNTVSLTSWSFHLMYLPQMTAVIMVIHFLFPFRSNVFLIEMSKTLLLPNRMMCWCYFSFWYSMPLKQCLDFLFSAFITYLAYIMGHGFLWIENTIHNPYIVNTTKNKRKSLPSWSFHIGDVGQAVNDRSQKVLRYVSEWVKVAQSCLTVWNPMD